uniref:Uncharacterized protein n=1 Tax=Anguilla anguilla TaxID=7936 RepID=A0A0E9XBH3_ANGAN
MVIELCNIILEYLCCNMTTFRGFESVFFP